ncbi:hypothetical protein NECID01_1203 [Nematocida sp. AWRm77]|nr:hypothetical protein NECID01_1203 [Nematocida sp. AWRm77]
MVSAIYCAWLILLKGTVLAHSTDIETLDFELTDELEIMCADVNPGSFYSDYSGILESPPRDNQKNMLQENQTPGDSYSVNLSGPSCTVNSVVANDVSSTSLSLSLPSTSTSTSTDSTISSVQVQSSADSIKRACDQTETHNGEKTKTRKIQKAMTMNAEANTALMDETEACLTIEEFGRYFRDGTKYSGYMSRDMLGFAEDLAQRGLTSAHSRKIVDLCTASEQWLGHSVFWRMLLFFVDTLSLELTDLNQLEGKKTIALRDRICSKSLSECADRSIYNTIDKVQDAVRMEIQYNLGFLEDKGTEDAFSVLRWLLYHVNIRRVEIICDLTKQEIDLAIFRRQLTALTKEKRGNRVYIDSLALYFKLAQHMAAAEIIKHTTSITMLKIGFLPMNIHQIDSIDHILETLLSQHLELEKLCVSGVRLGIKYTNNYRKASTPGVSRDQVFDF